MKTIVMVRDAPIGKPIPLDSYRSFKKTNTQKRTDRIEALAEQLSLPPSAIGKVELPVTLPNLKKWWFLVL